MKTSVTDRLKILFHVVLWDRRHRRGQYSADEVPVVNQFLQPADACIDIGAHAGSWTRPLAFSRPAGQVYAFEALPYYAAVLERAVRWWGLKNVRVVNCAVSDADGTTDIAWRTKGGRKLTGNTHMVTGEERTEMECVTVSKIALDAWVAREAAGQRIGFIKIDVEGAELFVLRGAQRVIGAHRPLIFMEIVTECCARYGYTPAILFDLFGEMGYEPFRLEFAKGIPSVRPVTAQSYPGKGDVLLVPRERVPEIVASLGHPRGERA